MALLPEAYYHFFVNGRPNLVPRKLTAVVPLRNYFSWNGRYYCYVGRIVYSLRGHIVTPKNLPVDDAAFVLVDPRDRFIADHYEKTYLRDIMCDRPHVGLRASCHSLSSCCSFSLCCCFPSNYNRSRKKRYKKRRKYDPNTGKIIDSSESVRISNRSSSLINPITVQDSVVLQKVRARHSGSFMNDRQPQPNVIQLTRKNDRSRWPVENQMRSTRNERFIQSNQFD